MALLSDGGRRMLDCDGRVMRSQNQIGALHHWREVKT